MSDYGLVGVAGCVFMLCIGRYKNRDYKQTARVMFYLSEKGIRINK